MSSTPKETGRAVPAELPLHAMCFEVLLVELPAEPRRVTQLDRAPLEPRPIGDEVPPDRVAVGMEALDEGSVRDRGEQMRCDLRLLVVRHLHVEGVCDAGH